MTRAAPRQTAAVKIPALQDFFFWFIDRRFSDIQQPETCHFTRRPLSYSSRSLASSVLQEQVNMSVACHFASSSISSNG